MTKNKVFYGQTVSKTLSKLGKVKADLQKHVVPYARAGSNKQAAKALYQIFEGMEKLADAILNDCPKTGKLPTRGKNK